MLKGFKEFLMRGNIVDLAVAVVIGTAFTAVVTKFTEVIINPLIAAVGAAEAPGWGFYVRAGDEATFVNIGAVITALINFLIVAAVVYFLVVLPFNKLQERRKRNQPEEEAEEPSEETLLLREIRDILDTARRADEREGPRHM